MASINKKDGSPFYWAWYRDANCKQRSKSTQVLMAPPDSSQITLYRETAQTIADDFERRAKQGLPLEDEVAQNPDPFPGVPSFNVFVPVWIQTLGGDPSYRCKVTSYMENISRFLGPKGDWALYRLLHSHFLAVVPFVLDLKYSLTTARHHQQILHALFVAAERKGYILASPITRTDYVKNAKRNGVRPFEIDQIEHLVNSTSVVDWRSALLFGFYLGMDLLEAIGQDWPNINFETHELTWNSHSRNGAPIQMTLPMHPLLETHLLALNKHSSSGHVTPKLRTMSESALRSHFQMLLDDAKFTNPAKQSMHRRLRYEYTFGSFKAAFAKAVGYSGLYRLARFLRNLPPDDRRAKVAGLPALRLKPLPLLNPD